MRARVISAPHSVPSATPVTPPVLRTARRKDAELNPVARAVMMALAAETQRKDAEETERKRLEVAKARFAAD